MKTSIVKKFVERITNGKSKQHERFYEIFSARGFLLEVDGSSEKIRLSNESHIDDCEFLEILKNINYKNIYNKPHQDSINEDDKEDAVRYHHAFFDDINIQLFDINNTQYLNEVFTNKIPIDLFRL
ncbi:MAG: hypothetical protein ACE5H1_03765, partial [Thermodesulfobacteriota bacterium]